MKSVNYKGNKIKVDFKKENYTKVVDKKVGIHIAEAHGTVDYIINGVSYTIKWELKRNSIKQRSAGVKLLYKGFSCADNEKKMIEHLISR